ncbi:5718_t:CDS:10 [Diversispora eburnea]|uniref:5718_t:CDS:1 n=1 Tax=Diversispora eburnea TaxID=1213867 RepID=A0A9N9ALQ9_9GLOM|nr:5718_t:CDS:10 [Diversispora eburnea]
MTLRSSARSASKQKSKEADTSDKEVTELKETDKILKKASSNDSMIIQEISNREPLRKNRKKLRNKGKGKAKYNDNEKSTTARQKVIQHSDGTESLLESIDSEWLQSNADKGKANEPNDEIEDEDDEEIWEEVDLSQYQSFQSFQSFQSSQSIESIDSQINDDLNDDSNEVIKITFSAPKIKYKPRGITKIERVIRQNLHKTHLLTLLAHGIIRNRWCDDPITQAMACSLIERDMLSLVDKALRPKDSTRGQLLITTLKELCNWWKKYFIISKPGLRYREYDEFGVDGIDKYDENFCEIHTSIKSFRRSLKMGEGSRDTSSQLFVALLRSFGIPARLIWRYKLSTQNKNNSIRKRKDREGDDDEYIPYLKKAASNSRKSQLNSSFLQKWMCVDPIRAIVSRPKTLEPLNNDKNNVMAYVVAYEQDGYIKDVTRRYTSQWGARTRKLRIPNNKDGSNWWDEVLAYYARPYEREQDKFEDASLVSMEISERIPTTINAFHNHPLYALERHLKKFEIIFPKDKILGHIRGEPIYRRNNVKQLHTAETWLKEGRQEGEQPVKYVKSRAYTLTKRRLSNMSLSGEGNVPESGLYGEWQTEEYKSEPVIDGIIPKNKYGNVYLFKPSMCPPGGVHLPYNGIWTMAKNFGFDYGIAVVGFEFVSQRCIPVLNGIIVAEEYAELLTEAWTEHKKRIEEINREKKSKEAFSRWKKLIIGLQIRQRLKEDYITRDEEDLSLEYREQIIDDE